jgi:hypothetical protein
VAGDAQPEDFDFIFRKEKQDHVETVLERLREDGHIPEGWSSPNLKFCFSHPSRLKSHDWHILAGPMGKYALRVCGPW